MILKEENPLGRFADDALTGMARLLKAVAYYPPEHPALREAACDALRRFAPLFQGERPFMLGVRRDGFAVEERLVPSSPQSKRLCAHLFARRVQTLTFLPDLSEGDLLLFSRILTREPADLQGSGGIAEVLKGARVGTIRVNETDLATILADREARENPPSDEIPEGGDVSREPPPPPSVEEGDDLSTLLQKLRQENSEARYRGIVQEIVSILHLRLYEEDRLLVLDVLETLRAAGNTPGAPMWRREAALQGLRHLEGEVVSFLVDFLCGSEIDPDLRKTLSPLLLWYGEAAASSLMEKLTGETEPHFRRAIMELLVLLGPQALPTLRGHLRDGRWFVVRNAAGVMGEIRSPEAVDDLESLLAHSDLRVRREAVRALTRIGAPEAVSILLRIIEGEDSELTRHTLLSLGALRDHAAIPILLRLAGRPDPFVRRTELRKGAIRALGEIGALEAAPTLVRILRRKSPWRRTLADDVRAAAAVALGEIGEGGSTLEKALGDRSPLVARAAAQALKQIRKGAHESGND